MAAAGWRAEQPHTLCAWEVNPSVAGTLAVLHPPPGFPRWPMALENAVRRRHGAARSSVKKLRSTTRGAVLPWQGAAGSRRSAAAGTIQLPALTTATQQIGQPEDEHQWRCNKIIIGVQCQCGKENRGPPGCVLCAQKCRSTAGLAAMHGELRAESATTRHLGRSTVHRSGNRGRSSLSSHKVVCLR